MLSAGVRSPEANSSFRFVSTLMPLNRSVSTRLIIDFTMILTSSSQPVIALVIDNKFTATKIFSVSLYLRIYKIRVADHCAFGNAQVIPPDLADAGVRMSREDRKKLKINLKINLVYLPAATGAKTLSLKVLAIDECHRGSRRTLVSMENMKIVRSVLDFPSSSVASVHVHVRLRLKTNEKRLDCT